MSKSVQKNLRITPELDESLKAAASRSGLSESELLRRGIERVCVRDVGLLERTEQTGGLGGREGAVRRRGPSGGVGVGAPVRRVDLAVWLAGRTGQPRSLARRMISGGRVAVRGEVVRESSVDGPLGALDVTVDGQSV